MRHDRLEGWKADSAWLKAGLDRWDRLDGLDSFDGPDEIRFADTSYISLDKFGSLRALSNN